MDFEKYKEFRKRGYTPQQIKRVLDPNYVPLSEYKRRQSLPKAGVDFTPISEFPKMPMSERIKGVRNFSKELGKDIFQYGKELGAGGIDFASRLSPLEAGRNLSSGVKEMVTGDKGQNPYNEFLKGFYESRGRETLFEKARGKSLTKQEGGIDWKEGRAFVARAVDIPTFLYSGVKASAMAGKNLITRLLTRTGKALPEAGIATGTQQFEQGNFENVGTNLLINSLLMSLPANIGGEVKLKNVNKSISAIEKELGPLSPDEKIDVIDALQIGTKSEDIIANAKKIREDAFDPEEVAERLNQIKDDVLEETGIKKGIEKIDASKQIADTQTPTEIATLLKGKVAPEDIPTLSRALKNINDPDQVARIIDEYDPVNINAKLVEDIALADTEKQIASLLKGKASRETIEGIAPFLKTRDDSETIMKTMEEFDIKLKSATVPEVKAPKVDTPEVKAVEPEGETPQKQKSSKEVDTTNAEDLSDKAVNSFKNAPEDAELKPNRLRGENLSIEEARTSLAKNGENIKERIVFGKDDNGKIVLKDGRHLLEAYRREGLPVPKEKIKFEDGSDKDFTVKETQKSKTQKKASKKETPKKASKKETPKSTTQKKEYAKVKEALGKKKEKPAKKESKTALRIKELYGDKFDVETEYDPITIKNELDEASEAIVKNIDEAKQKAFSEGEGTVKKQALRIELFEKAVQEENWDEASALFSKIRGTGTETAQALNIMKVYENANPQTRYMKEIIQARMEAIKSVKISKDKTIKAKELLDKTKKEITEITEISVKETKDLLNKLTC